MTTETLAPFDPLAHAIAAADGLPEIADAPMPAPAADGAGQGQGPPDHRLQR